MHSSPPSPAADAGRRRTLGLLATAALPLGWAADARARDWPTRTVRVIVPFPPGGGADGSARVLAEVMGPRLGEPMVVDNRAGGGSIVGTTAAVQSNDGHTLLMGSTSMTILPALRTDLSYDVQKDLQPVGMVSSQPLVLCVAVSSPLRTLDQLLAQGRADATLTSGNSGSGTLSHLTTELFNLKMGTRIRSVPYRGESALMPDIVGGTLSMGFLNLPSAQALLKGGRLRALAVTSAAPLPALPGVPTLRSLGLDEVIEGWAALFAARDVPAAGVERLDQLLQQALAEDTVRKRFENLGVAPTPGNREALRKYVQNESARWAEVVRARGIRLE